MLQIERIDGVPATASRFRELLEAHGFHAGYRGLALRADDRPLVPTPRNR